MESIRNIYKIGYGPSSSHTMGPQIAIEQFLQTFPLVKRLEVTLFGSLALTGKGHLTDYIIEKTAAPLPVSFTWKAAVQIEEHPNTMDVYGFDGADNQIAYQQIYSIGGGNILIAGSENETLDSVYPHQSFTAIHNFCNEHNLSLLAYINRFDPHLDEYLKTVWQVMQSSIERGIHNKENLKGSLHLKRKAAYLYHSGKNELNLSAYAYAVNEENASASGLVVTAPTCGACGTLPAVLRFSQENEQFSEQKIIDALKIAGLIGTLIKTNASISGAVAGCQAEVGSATSMAAAALAFLHDCSISTIESAAEIAMEHQLGLTCDPVDGYVQIPCIQRNAIAAQKAITAYTLAVELQAFETVSFDTIIDVMYETGKDLPFAYRETSKGGLAVHYKKKHKMGPMC